MLPQIMNRIVVVLVLLSITTFSLSTAFGVVLDQSLGETYAGIPIAATPFAGISSAEPSVAMFPGSPIQITEDSISMQVSYNESELANLTEAVESSLLFMNQFEYIASLNFTLDEGWSRLESAKWLLRFCSANADVYIGVNAVTCSVDEYHVAWIGPSPYVRTLNNNILSVHDIELAAVSFFRQNNLTLSMLSYYIPAELEYSIGYLTHNVYAVRFFEVANRTLVVGNVIEVCLDVLTGDVVSFNYHWVFVNEIPTSGVIGKSLANEYAVEYLKHESTDLDYRITRTALLFKNFGSYRAISYTLCWAVYTDNSEYAVVYVNAKSGEIIDSMQYVSLSSFLDNTRVDPASVMLPFMLSIPLGLLAYVLANHMGRKNQEAES
jgi:hypothetical protein